MRSLNAAPYHVMCWFAARPKLTAIAITALIIGAHGMEGPM